MSHGATDWRPLTKMKKFQKNLIFILLLEWLQMNESSSQHSSATALKVGNFDLKCNNFLSTTDSPLDFEKEKLLSY